MAAIDSFGQTKGGDAVQAVTLRSDAICLRILTLGAVLQSVRMTGVAHDLTLGSPHLADYEGDMCYYGSLVAPVVNRITGAQAMIAGQMAQFERNFLGRHVLHSGASGAQHQVWTIADHGTAEDGGDFVTLALHLPDGLGGFPGNRDVTARFTLTGNSLRMDVSATCDAPTLWNAANHSYWNLDGSDTYSAHSLRIAADHYLPTDAACIPTGEIAILAGTPFDFRVGRVLGAGDPPLDNCFCLGRGQSPLREVLVLRGASGVTLRLSTTEAGVQLYDCRHDGYRGLAIEAQNWPDAPHHAGFPSIALAAGAARVQTTQWQFSKE